MKKEEITRRNPSLGFIIGCLINYNFRSFKRYLIYIFHYLGLLNLNNQKSDTISDKDIIDILTEIHPEKIEKKVLYLLTNLSKTTFNKYFKDFFDKKKFKGKRKFTLYEIYEILLEWQGKGKWTILKSINKKTIAKVISQGNYKKLSSEFELFDGNYKNKDKFSPKEVKSFLKHIEFENENELMEYTKFRTQYLWFFGIIMIVKTLEKKTAHNRVDG